MEIALTILGVLVGVGYGVMFFDAVNRRQLTETLNSCLKDQTTAMEALQKLHNSTTYRNQEIIDRLKVVENYMADRQLMKQEPIVKRFS